MAPQRVPRPKQVFANDGVFVVPDRISPPPENAGAHRVVFASGKSRAPVGGEPHTSFRPHGAGDLPDAVHLFPRGPPHDSEARCARIEGCPTRREL